MGVKQPETLIDASKMNGNCVDGNCSKKTPSKDKLNLDEVTNDTVQTNENLAKKESSYKIDLSKEPENVEECLVEIKSLLSSFLQGQVTEVRSIFKQRAHVSFLYEVACCSFDFLDSLLRLDKENLEIALRSVTSSNLSANKYRKKMGFMDYLIRGDFKDHQDIEAFAEAAHSFTQILNAMVFALLDQGIYGIINAGIKAKTSYSSLKNCTYIIDDKKNWESEINRTNFEAMIRAFIGSYDLIVSFCPSKITRVLDMIGFSSDRVKALKNIRKSFEFKDSVINELALIVLMIHHLFLNYFFGIGDTDTKFICESTKKWETASSKEVFLLFGRGSKEMVLSNPSKAALFFEEAIRSKGHFRQITYLAYWQLLWTHTMLGQWEQSAYYAKLLKDDCNWSRALFYYLHAVFMQHQMDLEGKKELKDSIEESLKLIPKIKRNLGGKLAFHEALVLEKSKRYANKSEDMLLPGFELMYLWNIFNMMSNTPELFTPMMKIVETKLEQLEKERQTELNSKVEKDDTKKDNKKEIKKVNKKDEKKYLEKYCYLIFIKGVLLRHLNQKPEAIHCFEEIIKHDSKLDERNLVPQACFEIGMINYETNHFKETKRWFKKVRNLYSSYITQNLIEYRIQWTLDIIKSKKNDFLEPCEE